MKHFFKTTVSCAAFTVLALATSPALAGPKGHMSGTHMFDEGMAPILANYLTIQQALAKDSTSGIPAAAKAIAKQAPKLDAKSVEGEHAEHYKNVPENLQKAAKTLSTAGDLAAARDAFKALSKPMAMWGSMSMPDGVNVLFCSMAKGSWLQKTGDVHNPYLGKSSSCGEIVGGASHKGGMKGMKHGDMKSGHGKH